MGKYTEDCNTMCNISNISQGKCLKIKIKSLEKSHNKFYLILYPSNRRKYHKKILVNQRENARYSLLRAFLIRVLSLFQVYEST